MLIKTDNALDNHIPAKGTSVTHFVLRICMRSRIWERVMTNSLVYCKYIHIYPAFSTSLLTRPELSLDSGPSRENVEVVGFRWEGVTELVSL